MANKLIMPKIKLIVKMVTERKFTKSKCPYMNKTMPIPMDATPKVMSIKHIAIRAVYNDI